MRPLGLVGGLALTLFLLLAGGWLSAEISTLDKTVELQQERTAVGGLEVQATGLASSEGKLLAAVYDDAQAWNSYDGQSLAGFKEVPAIEGTLLVRFPELTAGPYAVLLHHDLNGNGLFDMSGDLPLEGYGLSGALDALDEPDFARASVSSGRVSVAVHYLVEPN
ncbi:MAG: hypothetical protein Kilf2KO_39020 [Rhodospirillales bacterium]